MPPGLNVRSVQLAPGSSEYQAVMSKFHATVPGVNIVKIERIQNTFLYQSYMVRKQKLDKDIGGNSELQLFHGTDGKNISDINETGFNRSYCGINGTAYGRGVYFARDASYSANAKYAGGVAGSRHMYLARVLVGQYCLGNPSMITPPPKNPIIQTVLYDSVVDNLANPTIFVVFFDSTCYPEYLITF
ncbi:protein mono-ADP-ribosyltransferase PARP15-like [Oculina patagonica]